MPPKLTPVRTLVESDYEWILRYNKIKYAIGYRSVPLEGTISWSSTAATLQLEITVNLL